jgi:aspartyl-tRNA(Asn)/glutamyl-tRNA(Gln) amidotransferase subunit A
VRLPASFCGVYGYKPTYGLISRSGIVAMASSTDVVGVMANSADDTAQVINVLAGRDELDSTTIDREKSYIVTSSAAKDMKIGVIKEYFGDGTDPRVSKKVKETIDKLKSAGAKIEEVSLPSLPLALAVYYIVCPAEVSSNLARYDGQRYGLSAKEAKDLEDSYMLSREEGFGAEAKRRIMIGSHVLSSGYYDAYYKKAQTVRTKIIKEFTEAFQKFDFLVGPTSPTTAFKIGERAHDPLKMYLSDIMLVAANISGNPAISVPVGMADGLPVGLQVIAKQKADQELLEVAKLIGELK